MDYRADKSRRKTALAIEYAYMVQESFPCAVFWVHASNRTRFEQSYREIADALKLPGRDDPQQNVLQIVEAWLKRVESGTWLMILDNADDSRMFFNPESSDPEAELLRYLPQSPTGTVLVTTRYKRAAAIICEEHLIEVPPMTSSEACALLEKKLNRRIQPMDEYDELLMDLEYLPLAIAQAAAFITYNSIDINEYLRMLRENESSMGRLMTEPFADRRRDRQVPNSVIATWSLSFDQIKREDNNSVEVLSLMSVLDRQRIPQSIVKQAFAFDGLDLTKALGRLKSFYLIVPHKGEVDYDMHRLVQISMRTWLVSSSALQRWQLRALAVLAEAFPVTGFQLWPERWPVCSEYLPHADAVLEYTAQEKVDSLNKLKVLYLTAQYVDDTGNNKDAERRYQETVDLSEAVLGPDNAETLETLDILGATVRSRGRFAEAEAIHRRVMEGLMKVHGPDHPATWACYGNMGNALEAQGKYEEAEAYHQKALEGQSKHYGPDELNHVIQTLSDLSTAIMGRGRVAEAERMRRRVVQRYEEVLGPDHPKTINALHNLGMVLDEQGKLHEAVAVLQLALEGREKVLGPEHPDTLRTVNMLGCSCLQLKRVDDAEPLLRRALEFRERVLGPEHPHTLNSWNNMAVVLKREGRNIEALSMAQRALEGSEKLLGLTHPDTLTTVGIVAGILIELKRYDEAEALDRRALDGCESTLGPEHQGTLLTVHNLAYTLEMEGKLDEAERLARRASTMRQKVLGTGHPYTISSFKTLARILQRLGRKDEADEISRQLYE